ncbi:MAG: ABC transporter ATP-binding protein [Nitrospinota bacterium]|nr:ABC transporter ATP-binding protein [Nitrospinota bacterium]
MLKLNQVSKTYHVGNENFPALQEITLDVEPKAFLAFVGPSGSGKTTLLNLIGGLDRPTSGEIIFNGCNLKTMSNEKLAALRREKIGFIFQSHSLLPVYNVYENVLFPLLLCNEKESEVRDRVMDMVVSVGLGSLAKKKPAELSGGQCQRAAIARALIKQPSLVLADEPTANLDTKNSCHILELMRDLNEKTQVAFLFSTHDDRVIKYIHREIHLDDGSVSWDKRRNGTGVLE